VVLAIPVTFYVMSRLDIAHIPQDRLAAALTAAMKGNPLIYGIQLALGMACSVLGGYVAGLIARHDHMLNGALSSWLCLALGIHARWRKKFALRRDGDSDAGIKPGAGALRGIYLEQAKGSGPSCRGDSIKLISPGRQLCAAPSGAPLLL